jgi:pyruvate, orthophosphate dikinase
MKKDSPHIALGGIGIGSDESTDVLRWGAKATSLATLARLGLPVPPTFVIDVESCRIAGERGIAAIATQMGEAMVELEAVTGRKFGDEKSPLLVAVRPSATSSFPGMAEAILNLGLNDETVSGFAAQVGDQRHAQDCYRRFIQNYAHVVMGDDPTIFEDVHALYMEERGFVSATELQGSDSAELVSRFKAQ